MPEPEDLRLDEPAEARRSLLSREHAARVVDAVGRGALARANSSGAVDSSITERVRCGTVIEQKTNAPGAFTLAGETPDAQEEQMVDGLSAAGNPAGLSMDALLLRRRSLLASMVALDDELDRRGVRATEKPRGAPRTAALLLASALSDGPLDARAIAARTGQGLHACHQMLSKLVAAGELRRVGRGRYALRVAS